MILCHVLNSLKVEDYRILLEDATLSTRESDARLRYRHEPFLLDRDQLVQVERVNAP